MGRCVGLAACALLGGSQGLISRLLNDTTGRGPMLYLEAALLGGFFAYNMVCEAPPRRWPSASNSCGEMV